MNERESDKKPSPEDRVSLEASAWIAKRDEGFTSKEQDAFFEWLAEDPEHKAVYAERLALWEEMDLMTGWRPDHSREPNPDLLSYRRKSRWRNPWIAVGSIAAALAVGLFILGPWNERDRVETRVLAFGGAASYENHVLDDGSIVELNRGAEASIQYARDRRLVFLHAGEAHFMVAKDSARPFQVRAGEMLVEATGTAFNVALEEDGVEVLVTEGSILLDSPSLIASDGSSDYIKRPPSALVAGQRSKIVSDQVTSPPEIVSVTEDEIDQRLAWKSEDLDFTSSPLSEVAEAFNRRNRVKIVVGDTHLRDLPITAKLRSNNLDGFLELLDVTMNIVGEKEDVFEIVLRERSQ